MARAVHFYGSMVGPIFPAGKILGGFNSHILQIVVQSLWCLAVSLCSSEGPCTDSLPQAQFILTACALAFFLANNLVAAAIPSIMFLKGYRPISVFVSLGYL